MNDQARIEPAMPRSKKQTEVPANVLDLESEIGQVLQRQTPVPVVMPATAYRRIRSHECRGGVGAVRGRRQKSVEEMGEDVKERIGKLAAAMTECDKDMKIIDECAEMIRDKGKLVQAQIEEAAALRHDIRAACVEFKRKVGP